MDLTQLQSVLIEHQITPTNLRYIVEQGIEMEKLKLEVERSLNHGSVDSFVKIMQADRFSSLLCFLVVR